MEISDKKIEQEFIELSSDFENLIMNEDDDDMEWVMGYMTALSNMFAEVVIDDNVTIQQAYVFYDKVYWEYRHISIENAKKMLEGGIR